MKQHKTRVIPKYETKLKLNPAIQNSLQILSMNSQDLLEYIKNEVQTNPLLEFESSFSSDQNTYESALNYVFKEKGLKEFLIEQLHLYFDEIDYELAEYIINLLNTNGYLTSLPDEIANDMHRSVFEVEKLLDKLKEMEPTGVFAKDLKECLLLQLRQFPSSETAIILVEKYLFEIAKGKLNEISKKLGCDREEIEKAVALIQRCNPNPGSGFSNKATAIFPEVIVNIDEDEEFTYTLLHSFQELKFNDIHFEDQSSKTYLAEKRKEAKKLLHSVSYRNKKLLELTALICEYQRGYLLNKEPLYPLTQDFLAKRCNLSISSVSRCLMHKGIDFQHRFIAYSDFFSPLLHGKISSHEAKRRIVEIIKSEDKETPLSDQKISEKLKQVDIYITQRTVAKYRKQMRILNSHYRKKSK